MNKPNLFGTAGIRAKAGTYPLDQATLIKIGEVLASFFINKYGKNSKILIACDTRKSSYLIKALIKAGLLNNQVLIYDAQILSTPAVNYLVHELKSYHAGIIITASHNPYQDNGIKIIDQLNGNLTNLDELEISDAIFNQDKQDFNTEFLNAGQEFHTRSCIDTYSQKILDQFSTQDFNNLHVIIDCANGATAGIAPGIFTKLGVRVIAINTNPTGTNINLNSGASSPEILRQTVLKYKAQIGFAFDGDGDRITVVTQDGKIKDGDDLIAFLSTNPKYQAQASLVGTLVSNLGLELWLNQLNKNLIRTDVGEKNLLLAQQANNHLIGGEPSGHIILKDFAKHSDGIFVALRILETCQATNNWLLTTFTRTPQVSHNLPVKIKQDLNTPALASTINKYKNLIKPGRLIVRYSGTENLLRLLAEGENPEQLNQVIVNMTKELDLLLNS